MGDNEREQADLVEILVLENQPDEEAPMPPWLFRHDDLLRVLSSAPLLEKKKLTNALNHIHFQGGHVHILMKHPLYEECVLFKAKPEPCMGEKLTCLWDQAYVDYNLGRYLFQYLIVAHEQAVIVAPAALLLNSSDNLTLQLPEKSHVISDRQVARFICHDVSAELWQNGFQATGELIDFSPHAFRIRVQATPPSSFQWFNTETPSTIRFSHGRDVLFSGNCTCIQQKQNGLGREIVLATMHDQIKRFPAKVLRNPRRQPSPPFNALFEHPFSRKKIQREIFDISTSGISIYDKSDEVVLMPGMIIPEMNVVYAGILKIQCKAQVIYRKEEDGKVRFGIAILDMDLTNYNNLSQILNNIQDLNTAKFNEVDLDELWEFFFDTDFIYPKKYKHLHAFREDFQKTYRKLYRGTPDIAKHFSYQKNGRIYSHISMLRAYERTWMVHHHAARPLDGKHTGLIVLKQLIHYLIDVHRLPSANMDYVMCYFRPKNKFTDRVYTTFAKEQANPQICSLDMFGYLTFSSRDRTSTLPREWSLRDCSASDIWELEQYYKRDSGGLFWNVMGLTDRKQVQSLEKVYTAMGFARKWKAFALQHLSDLKAVIIAEESDVAFNLSDLLNGFKVLVIDPNLSPDILFAAISDMTTRSPAESCPLMIYPASYVLNSGINCEKQYYQWILNLEYTNEYIEYLRRNFRRHII